ncbi:hypothetical protein IVB30_05385 [Bradyrhizobium sp. 200]|uniref:hypothetical protein n=1 Tax=Bradyrhizobium sp. 200 TaxID=2782665 RepID=UPI001FFFE07E|nr:hypothetical protein [Bradyrhizobium sp. 200]UPJ50835.1 hypothetical protein IVB30_05385 [Bradyrhizobium sp. 200]
MQRKRSIPHSFDERLAAEKKQLEEQAALLPPGSVKDVVLRKIGQLNTAIHVSELLKSPGSRSPE